MATWRTVIPLGNNEGFGGKIALARFLYEVSSCSGNKL